MVSPDKTGENIENASVHPVVIDRRAMLAELEAMIMEAARAEKRQAKEQRAAADELETAADSSPGDWLQAAQFVVMAVDKKICPAWELADEEKAELAGHLAATLDDFLPGGAMGFERWPNWAKLAATVAMVAGLRYDMERARPANYFLAFKPLHAAGDDDGTRNGAAPGWADGGDLGSQPDGQDHGGFTTVSE